MTNEAARAETSKPTIRFGIGKKLSTAFAGATAITVISIGVALVSYTNLSSSFEQVAQESLPAISGALKLEKEASAIVAVGASVASAKTEKDRAIQLANLAKMNMVITKLMTDLSATDKEGGTISAIQSAYKDFSTNIGKLKASIDARLQTGERIKNKTKEALEFRNFLGSEFENIMDGQRTDIVTAMREESPDVTDADELRGNMMRVVFTRVGNLQDINKIPAASDQLVAAMSGAVNAPNEVVLGNLINRFVQFADIARATISITELASNEDGKKLVEYFENLAKLGEGPDSVFELRRKELSILEEENKILNKSAKLSALMGRNANKLVEITQNQIAATQAEVRKTAAQTKTLLIVLAVLAIIGSIIIAGVYVRRQIVARITHISDCMDSIADGNLETRIPRTGNDEITAMALSVRVFRENAKENVKLVAEQKETERKAAEHRRQILDNMAANLEDSVGQVVTSLSDEATKMQSSAKSLLSSASENISRASTVASASELASSNVQTVAAAAEELSSSISEISNRVADSTRVAANAVNEAEESTQLVRGLDEASQKIGDVVSMITDIAEQTNLLALNATIEAARAGDAGKGFAVVASEVKNLASQTAKATDEINAQINDVQTATKKAVEAIENIAQTIGEISNISSSIAAAVEEQSASTQEIARNVDQAAGGTQEVSDNIQGVTVAAQETDDSARIIDEGSKELSGIAEALSEEVEKFLTAVRTG